MFKQNFYFIYFFQISCFALYLVLWSLNFYLKMHDNGPFVEFIGIFSFFIHIKLFILLFVKRFELLNKNSNYFIHKSSFEYI